MKTKLLLLGLVFSVTAIAFADVKVPEWKEVAPQPYVNIDLEKNYRLPLKQYWQQRRKTFEFELNNCTTHAAIKGEEYLDKCYEGVVKLEQDKNQIREQNLTENSRSILRDSQY